MNYEEKKAIIEEFGEFLSRNKVGNVEKIVLKTSPEDEGQADYVLVYYANEKRKCIHIDSWESPLKVLKSVLQGI